MNTRPLLLLALLGFATPLTGCDQIEALTGGKEKAKKADDDDGEKKKKKKKKADDETEEEEDRDKTAATASATAEPTAEPAPSATEVASADAAPTASGDAPAVPTPAGRSAVPTTEDWNGAPEVTVLGSSALGCETKQLREWIRVTCRGEDPTRGKPTTVNITKGGGKGDTFTFASGGVTSLVYPFYEGQDLGADFGWERAKKTYVAQWPQGAPKPTAYGIFEGGDAHLKPSVPTPTATPPKPNNPTPPATTKPTTEPPKNNRPVLKIPLPPPKK